MSSTRSPKVLIAETTCVEHLRKMQNLGWGRMFCQRKLDPLEGETWGFDNGAFLAWQRNEDFNEDRFVERLLIGRNFHAPLIAVTPDIVAAGDRSLRYSLQWRERLENGWPWYLAVQDGMEVTAVGNVMHLFSGLFLGGTDSFKLQAFRWCRLAHDHGKLFHYARAGTPKKLRHAIRVGADSLDSAFPLWTHDRFDKFARLWQHEDTQIELAYV